jgi:hypothetical protein
MSVWISTVLFSYLVWSDLGSWNAKSNGSIDSFGHAEEQQTIEEKQEDTEAPFLDRGVCRSKTFLSIRVIARRIPS